MNMNIADEASMARPVYICGVLIMIEPVRLHTVNAGLAGRRI